MWLFPKQAPTGYLGHGDTGRNLAGSLIGKPLAWSASRGGKRRLGVGKGRNDLSDKHSMIKLLSGLFNSPYCPQES